MTDVVVAARTVRVPVQRVAYPVKYRRRHAKLVTTRLQRTVLDRHAHTRVRVIGRRQQIRHVVRRTEQIVRPGIADIEAVQRVLRQPVQRVGQSVAVRVRRIRYLDHATPVPVVRVPLVVPQPVPAAPVRPVVGVVVVARVPRIPACPVRVAHRRAARPRAPVAFLVLIRETHPQHVRPGRERVPHELLLRRVVDRHQVTAQRLAIRLRARPAQAARAEQVGVTVVRRERPVLAGHRGRVHLLAEVDLERAHPLAHLTLRRQPRHVRHPRRNDVRDRHVQHVRRQRARAHVHPQAPQARHLHHARPAPGHVTVVPVPVARLLIGVVVVGPAVGLGSVPVRVTHRRPVRPRAPVSLNRTVAQADPEVAIRAERRRQPRLLRRVIHCHQVPAQPDRRRLRRLPALRAQQQVTVPLVHTPVRVADARVVHVVHVDRRLKVTIRPIAVLVGHQLPR